MSRPVSGVLGCPQTSSTGFTNLSSDPPNTPGLGVGGTWIHTLAIFTPTFSHTTFIRRYLSFAPSSTVNATLRSGTTSATPMQTTTLPTVMAAGFVHGPLSATSTAAQTGGVMQLVSPTQVTSLPLSTFSPIEKRALFTRITVALLPEPQTFLALASGAALLGWRRARRH